MKHAVVTGAGGLVGSETVRLLIEEGFFVTGIDNDMRKVFFGAEASTAHQVEKLQRKFPVEYRHAEGDIQFFGRMSDIIKTSKPELIVHAAAQPSHDWAAKDPFMDFGVNANGTHVMLEAARQHAPEATFVHISTSKVYGDNPNRLKLVDEGERFDLPLEHLYWHGIDTGMSVDNCLHSLFGVSKLSGDLLVQEYGRYFGMPTVCFRPGCITGPAHQGVELHGFLAYLMKCCAQDRPYTVYGYDGKQVRCNIYARDLAKACLAFHEDPVSGAVYNIGGGRDSACSMREAISICEDITERGLNVTYDPTNRIGDHKWWISDIDHFQHDYDWHPSLDVVNLLLEIYEANADKWTSV